MTYPQPIHGNCKIDRKILFCMIRFFAQFV